jgi:predicted dienelactone hydrolase
VRFFEVLFVSGLLATVALVPFRSPAVRRFGQGAAIVGFSALALHLLVEGARWTLAPAYLVAALLAILALSRLRTPAERRPGVRLATVAGAALATLALALAAGLSVAFPVVDLPVPGGPHLVGTTTFEIVDGERAEILTEDPADVRAFSVLAWYPADPATSTRPERYREPAPTHGSITAEGEGAPGGPPPFIFSHLRHVRTHAHRDADPSPDGPFPVLVFSTGFLSAADNAQVLAQELASRGWIVLSMTHPYESEAVQHEDGRVVPFARQHAQDYAEHMRETAPLWAEFWSTEDLERRRAVAHSILDVDRFMDRQVRIRSADIRATIDALASGRAAPAGLIEAMDLSRLAVAGHSLGGATAPQVLLDDRRFRAGINLDGFQFGDVAAGARLDKPFALVYSESFAGANEFLEDRLGPAATVLTVAGATHMNFTDDAIVMPLTRRLGMAGTIEPGRMQRVLIDIVTTFLETHVNGVPGTPLDEMHRVHPELRSGEPLRAPRPPGPAVTRLGAF